MQITLSKLARKRQSARQEAKREGNPSEVQDKLAGNEGVAIHNNAPSKMSCKQVQIRKLNTQKCRYLWKYFR